MAIFGKLQDLLKEESVQDQKSVGQKGSVHSGTRRSSSSSDDAEMILLTAKAELDRRLGALEERERIVEDKEKATQERMVQIDKMKEDMLAKLEKAASMTREEARTLILKAWEERLKEDIAKRIRDAEAYAKQEADKKARQILIEAMQHGATDYVAEYTLSTVKISDEEMKGRVIGKEGRNIRAFEQATGVDVDLDEEGIIRLSSFDSVRREIARVSLEKLLRDTRIQPSRIEEVVVQTKKEIERVMFEEGQKLLHAAGIFNLHSDLIAYVGRYKYRFSYGQNMLAHSLEQVKIAVKIANEIGANTNVVRLGTLLSDIGKVITDKEGSHVDLGVELLKKYNLPKEVIDCVAEHHEDQPFSSTESVIVHIADAISGARPGARYEDLEGYVKKLSDLEDIAKAQDGVKAAFAIQAGREIRIIIDPDKLDDAQTVILAQKVKEEIEKKMTFPGEIRVTAIREFRAIETAK